MGHSRRLKIQRGTSWTWMMVGIIHTQHLEEKREVSVKSRVLGRTNTYIAKSLYCKSLILWPNCRYERDRINEITAWMKTLVYT